MASWPTERHSNLAYLVEEYQLTKELDWRTLVIREWT